MIKGIDISEFQSGLKIQYNKGYDFVILRGGFTGYGTGTSYKKDGCFEKFYKQCKDIGMPVGCYWYSCANNYQKGVNEANFLYDNCLKGKQFEYPIYIDVEENRHQRVGKKLVADAIRGFCETLENKGYYVGIYANLNYFKNYIDTPSLSMYDKWYAYWTYNDKKPKFPYGSFGLWQNSDRGNISGKRIDTDISYVDYPTLIKSRGFNGYSKNQNTNQNSESTNQNKEEIKSKKLQVGIKVKTINTGKASSDGTGATAVKGITGTIIKILPNKKFPYLISKNNTPIGWYKENSLEIL